MQKHLPLGDGELPKPGTVVSIDAEFVALQQVRYANWPFIGQLLTEFCSLWTRKNLSSGRMVLKRSFDHRNLPLQESRYFAEKTVHWARSPSLMTIFTPQTPLWITWLNTQGSNVRSCISMPLRTLIDTYISWRFRSNAFYAYTPTSQDGLQEAAPFGRFRMHFYWSWIEQRLSDYQWVRLPFRCNSLTSV